MGQSAASWWFVYIAGGAAELGGLSLATGDSVCLEAVPGHSPDLTVSGPAELIVVGLQRLAP